MFTLAFVESNNDVITEAAVEFLGAQFYVNVMLLVSPVNINVGAVSIRPVDTRSNEIFHGDTNKFQFLAGDLARMAFKAFREEYPEAFDYLKTKSERHAIYS